MTDDRPREARKFLTTLTVRGVIQIDTIDVIDTVNGHWQVAASVSEKRVDKRYLESEKRSSWWNVANGSPALIRSLELESLDHQARIRYAERPKTENRK